MIKIIFQILIIFFPWFIRRKLLCYFFNYKIHKTAIIGKSIILAENLMMDENSSIGNLTFCKSIGLLSMGKKARLGSINYITGFPQNNKDFFAHRINRKCQLIIGNHSAVTGRHFLDCTAGIIIGDFTTFAGIRSQILTHSIDIKRNIQDCKPVEIGSYCFVGTNVTILPGSILPNFSVLAAKSLLNKNYEKEETLYGGVPAKKIDDLTKNEYSYFKRKEGFVK